MAYSEQEGTYRQAGRNMGETAHLYARSTLSATVLEIWFIEFCRANKPPSFAQVFLSCSCHRLLNYFKSPANLVSQFGELKFEHRLLGIDHYIDRKRKSRPLQTNRLSQSPLNAITIDRAAQHSPNSESDAETFALLSQQIKNGHVSGEVPTALFVNSLEVSVPEQAHAGCKPGPLAGAGQIETTVRSETAHTIHDPDSDCGIAVNSGKGNRLLTEAGLHRHPLASLGTPPRDHRCAALGLHPGTKSVRLRAVTSVRLESALGHET